MWGKERVCQVEPTAINYILTEFWERNLRYLPIFLPPTSVKFFMGAACLLYLHIFIKNRGFGFFRAQTILGRGRKLTLCVRREGVSTCLTSRDN